VIKAPSRDNSEPRYLDGEDVGLLLRAAQNDLGFQACIALGAYAGMRRGSVHALRWQDVDFESRLITVRHAKGGKHYSVPMQPKLRNILQAWQAVSKENDSGYVYAHYWLGSWRPYYYRSSAQKLAKYARIAGLDPETGFHDFRRTFATTLHNKGVDIAVISRLLGHASIATTMAHYAFTSDKSRQEAVLAIDY
jgi:integrase